MGIIWQVNVFLCVIFRQLPINTIKRRRLTPRDLDYLPVTHHSTVVTRYFIAVSAIVGRISNHEIAGHYGAVMRDGSIVKVSRREQSAFNRVYRGLAK